MKQLSPSALRAHLAQRQAAGPHSDTPHPDADLLTAFAEDALLDHERTGVLAHLAACPDCRAILHTAAAAQPETDPQLEPVRAPLRTWLPAFALAASLLVVAASTIVFYRTLHTAPRARRPSLPPQLRRSRPLHPQHPRLNSVPWLRQPRRRPRPNTTASPRTLARNPSAN